MNKTRYNYYLCRHCVANFPVFSLYNIIWILHGRVKFLVYHVNEEQGKHLVTMVENNLLDYYGIGISRVIVCIFIGSKIKYWRSNSSVV